MQRRAPFSATLDGTTYTTKKAVIEHAQRILDANVEQRLGGSDEAFVRDLLSLHPEAGAKAGAGISHFMVHRVWTSRCFHVYRVDGTSTDFSFRVCINGANHAQDVQQALRHEVSGQITAFRAAFFDGGGAVCALSGAPVTAAASHVDHYEPNFVTLARRFLAQEAAQRGPAAVALAGVGVDNNFVVSLEDRALARRWSDYHAANAHLRMTTPAANMSRKRKGVV